MPSARTLFLVSIALLACIPFAHASISAITYAADGIEQVGTQFYILPGQVFAGSLTFTISEDVTYLYIDTGGLDQRSEDPKLSSIVAANCPNSVCTVPVTYYVDRQRAGELNWKYGEDETRMTTQRPGLQFDTQAPRLDAIGTPTCKQNCAVKSGSVSQVVAYFTETGLGIDIGTVGLMTPDGPRGAESCERTECTFNVQISSGEPGPVEFSLVPGVADRAGNTLSGEPRTYSLAVDDIDPVITKIEARQGSNIVPIITGSFSLTVTVDDDSPVKVIADTSAIAEDEETELRCTGNTCTASIKPLATVSGGTHPIVITVTDAAGNAVTETRTFSFATLVTGGDGEYWSVARGRISPKTFDPQAATLFTTRSFLTFSLVPNEDVQLAYVRSTGCTFKQNGRAVPLALMQQQPTVLGSSGETQTLILNIRPTQNILDERTGSILVTCGLDAYTYENGKLLSRPQKLNVTGTLTIKESPLLPQQYQAYLKEKEDSYKSFEKMYTTVSRIYGVAAGLCGALDVIDGVSATMRQVQVLLASLKIVPGALPAAQAVDAQATVQQVTTLGLRKGVVGPACSIVSCEHMDNLPWSKALENVGTGKFAIDGAFGDGTTDKLAQWGTGNGGANASSFLNPYDSFVVAGATFCAPAIMHHLETYREIKCEYQQCLKTDVPAGVPVSACEAEKAYGECRFVYGGVAGMLPVVNVYELLRGTALKLVTSPPAVVGMAFKLGGCKVIPDPGAKGLCILPQSLITAREASATYQKIQSVRQAFTTPRSCEPSGNFEDPYYNIPGEQGKCNIQGCRAGRYQRTGDKYYMITPVKDKTKPNQETITEINARDVPRTERQAVDEAYQRNQQARRESEQNPAAYPSILEHNQNAEQASANAASIRSAVDPYRTIPEEFSITAISPTVRSSVPASTTTPQIPEVTLPQQPAGVSSAREAATPVQTVSPAQDAAANSQRKFSIKKMNVPCTTTSCILPSWDVSTIGELRLTTEQRAALQNYETMYPTPQTSGIIIKKDSSGAVTVTRPDAYGRRVEIYVPPEGVRLNAVTRDVNTGRTVTDTYAVVENSMPKAIQSIGFGAGSAQMMAAGAQISASGGLVSAGSILTVAGGTAVAGFSAGLWSGQVIALDVLNSEDAYNFYYGLEEVPGQMNKVVARGTTASSASTDAGTGGSAGSGGAAGAGGSAGAGASGASEPAPSPTTPQLELKPPADLQRVQFSNRINDALAYTYPARTTSVITPVMLNLPPELGFVNAPVMLPVPLVNGPAFESRLQDINQQFIEGKITYDQADAALRQAVTIFGLQVSAAGEEAARRQDIVVTNEETAAERELAQARPFATKNDRAKEAIGAGLQMAAVADTLSHFGIIPRGWTRWDPLGVSDALAGASAVELLNDAVCKNVQERAPEVQAITSDGQIGLALIGIREYAVPPSVQAALEELQQQEQNTFGNSLGSAILPEEQFFYYAIRGRLLVQNEVAEDDEAEISAMTYVVRLRGPGGEKILVEDSFQVGTPVSWTNANMLRYEGLEEYDAVCIEFERPLKELFGEETQGGNEACLPLRIQ